MIRSFFLLLFFLCLLPLISAQREIWGTVSNGGNYGHGYIFKTDSVGDNLLIMHHFDSINGKDPGALLFASNNKLYGVTSAGGLNNQGLFNGGVLYEYDLNTLVYNPLQHFGPNNTEIFGRQPAGSGSRTLTEVSPGLIYGQLKGAYQGGVIFAYNTANHTISTALTLPTYLGGATNSTLGNRLQGNLYKAADGYLYGTTYTNSQCPIPNPDLGSIVRIDPVTQAFSIRYLAPCNISNGVHFKSDFVTYADKLYSVANTGGANNKGAIYSFDAASSTYTNKHSFAGGIMGWQPSTLVQGANGKFYGTADGGTPEAYHPYGCGILFEFDPATDLFTKKLDFTYGNGSFTNVGTFPFSLISGNNGKLYGITANGVFEYNIAANQTTAKGRLPLEMGWYNAASPSLTFVCRKPSYSAGLAAEIFACKGEAIVIDLQSDNAESILWKHNGDIAPGQAGNILQFNNIELSDAGSWQAELSNSCGVTLVETVIHVADDIQVSETDSSLAVSSGGSSFQWIDCQLQSPVQDATGPVFVPAQSGWYAVEVTNGSCVDTSACYMVSIAEDFSLPGQPQAGISIWPNPASTILHVNSTATFEKVHIYDISGKVLFSGTYQSEMDISPLKAGIYFISFYTSENTFYIQKFIRK